MWLWFEKFSTKKSQIEALNLDENPLALKERISSLDQSEYAIFTLMREGFSQKECKQKLNLKRGEVKKLTKSIFQKLDVCSHGELIIRCR